jgi:hypothetical protein
MPGGFWGPLAKNLGESQPRPRLRLHIIYKLAGSETFGGRSFSPHKFANRVARRSIKKIECAGQAGLSLPIHARWFKRCFCALAQNKQDLLQFPYKSSYSPKSEKGFLWLCPAWTALFAF